jgi:hypothetical protein
LTRFEVEAVEVAICEAAAKAAARLAAPGKDPKAAAMVLESHPAAAIMDKYVSKRADPIPAPWEDA